MSTWNHLEKKDFNPRTREGCDDLVYADDDTVFNISIHAPVKGATRNGSVFVPHVLISIHAPVKGATSILD